MLTDLIECAPVPHYNNHLCALADRKQMLTLARLAWISTDQKLTNIN
jgi:hypothetical protein